MEKYIEVPIYVACVLLSVLTFHFVAPNIDPLVVASTTALFIVAMKWF